MSNKRWSLGVSGLVLASLVLSACGQQAPQTIIQTAAPVIVTQIVPGPAQTVQVVVTATPAPVAQKGMKDTIIIGTWQEPRSLLDYANSQAIQVEINLIHRPRFVQRRNFQFQANPALVAGDLPTFENGGAKLVDVTVKKGEPLFDVASKTVISATQDTPVKQLVVTGKIKSGLKWSDGQPLTARDFIFAWKTNCDPDSGAIDQTYCPPGSSPGSSGLVTSYQAKDDTTLELMFTPGALDPTYQILVFGPEGTPQPEHMFKDMKPADIVKDERALGGANAVPLAYGAYMVKEWAKGDHISFAPNPNWAGDKPKTANVIYKFFSDSVALASAVIAGDVDASSGITGVSIDQYPYLTSVAKNGDIVLEVDKNAASFEMLVLNFNDPTDKNLAKPHPLLSDVKVRKAIAMSLDRKQMVDTIFFGQSSVVEQPHLPQMISYDVSQGKIDYDLEGAKKLMDDAGWKAGADGIREKNGVKASFTILTTSGNTLRQKSTQIMQKNLKDLGIDAKLDYKPSSVVFSADGLDHRVFEGVEFANVFSVVDPGSWWYGIAGCDQIPTPKNGFTGGNYAGWCDKEASDAVAHAAFLSLDPAERKKDWNVALKKYFENGFGVIPLFVRPDIMAYVPELSGAKLDPTEYYTWNIETWTLKEK